MNEGLFKRLVDIKRQSQVSFHVPGHKFGRDLTPVLENHAVTFETLDFTEIKGTDNLHAPQGAIKDAQENAAKAFGALETQFLVGGTTAGILAGVLGTVSRGKKLIMPRDAHRSVHSAVLLGGLEPVYIMPQLDRVTGISLGVQVEGALEAIKQHPDAGAVIITYPTYDGIACDLGRIIRAANDAGILVIADEAHAAHFGTSEKLPPTALSLGADLVAQSTHKTLTSLTQSSMLHYGTQFGLAAKPRVSAYLAMIQSTSPSYPLMASLDLAAMHFLVHGPERMNALLRQMEQFWEIAHKLGFGSLYDLIDLPEACRVDPVRLALTGVSFGLDGYALQEALEKRGIICEYATQTHALLIPSIASTENDFERLIEALDQISSVHTRENHVVWSTKAFRIPEKFMRAISGEAALWHDKILISLDKAAGSIAGEFLIPYPPGIPLVVPGEVITEEILGIILEELGINHNIHGVYDGRIVVLT